ncbi:hypothetical protein ACFLXT_04285 [Chloroflexota bacterium]
MKKLLSKKLFLFAGGVVMLALAGWSGAVYYASMEDGSMNMGAVFGCIVSLAGAGLLFYVGFNGFGGGINIMPTANPMAAGQPTSQVNSLNITVQIDKKTGKAVPVKVAFEDVKKPMGYPHQNINDGRWYFIHYKNVSTNKLAPFYLPDQQYYDPGEFSNVIKMKAHMDLFERRQTMFQKLAPWALVVAILIISILMPVVADL